MSYWMIDGKQMTDAEYEEHQRQELEAQERVRHETAALMRKLGETYDQLTGLLERNPEVARLVTDRTKSDEEVYRKLRENLSRAEQAPRCRWVKQDGTSCRSPQMRKHIYCFAHKQMMEARALMLRLPALEDGNAIQIALMRVQKALIDDTISTKKAGLLLYSLQLAMTNIGQTTFGQAKAEEMVTSTVDEEDALDQEALSGQRSGFRRDRKASTAEGAEDAETGKGTPRIGADYPDRDIGTSGHRDIGKAGEPRAPLGALDIGTANGARDRARQFG